MSGGGCSEWGRVYLWVSNKNQFLTTKPEGEDQQNIHTSGPTLGNDKKP